MNRIVPKFLPGKEQLQKSKIRYWNCDKMATGGQVSWNCSITLKKIMQSFTGTSRAFFFTLSAKSMYYGLSSHFTSNNLSISR